MTNVVLESTCLRPTYSLRRQLITSYGCTAFLAITIAVILGVIAASHVGEAVKGQTSTLLESQIVDGLQMTSIDTANIFTQRFHNLRGSAALLTEIIRDRLVGYPNDFESDRYVDYFDMETGERVYPLRGSKLPQDTEVVPNWNISNLEEHVQERHTSFAPFMSILSSISAQFAFQGNCDPDALDPQSPSYFENCTEANNDPSLGGVAHPTKTLAGLAEKSYDIGLFLKPLWESEPSAIQINVHYHNSGAGAILSFPSVRLARASWYYSSGCEWMRELNPKTGKPYGGDEQIARCSPAGTKVPMRLYNPMERDFCHDQIRHPDEIRIYGPYLDSVWGQWRLTVGQAVFDRLTGNFIACTAFDLNLQLASDLLSSVMMDNRTDVVVLRLDGTVVAGAGFQLQSVRETVHVTETGFIDNETFAALSQDPFWERKWDADTVHAELFKNHVLVNGKMMSCVPSPFPPNVYDSTYEPDFLVFLSADVEDVFDIAADIDDNIDEAVYELIAECVIIGFSGLFVLVVVVAGVSHVLTRPLNWMEATAWNIVNHANKRASGNLGVEPSLEDENDPLVRCTPRTEIGELVSEFQAMIRGFSGKGASRVATARMDEVQNFVTWKECFRQFYQVNHTMEERIKEEMGQDTQRYGRRISLGKRSKNNSGPTASDIIAGISEASQESEEENAAFRSMEMLKESRMPLQFARTDSSTMFQRPSTRTNLGSNLPGGGYFGKMNQIDDNVRISRSSLFRWILLSIVLPLVVTNFVIAVLVISDLADSFPSTLDEAEAFSIQLETDHLEEKGIRTALYGEHFLPGPLRDLYLVTRVSGWLLFGAISRSDSFTDLEMEMVEECKSYDPDEICPFDVDESRSPCDCEWDDPWGLPCDNFSVRTRQWQKMFYLGQARDFDPETGDRTESQSYPALDFNAESTQWWTNANEMPGSYHGADASGYTTTYDRVRVMSALSSVSLPLYNYPKTSNYRTSISSYFAFEADGGYLGYKGCNYDVSRLAHFRSSAANGALSIRSELCPEGKYGYDPRCRHWYATTKTKGSFYGDAIHIEPPYKFPDTNVVGTSASSPVIDPRTGTYVGTTAIDFSLTDIFDALKEIDADIFFVISPEGSLDTLIGTNYPLGSAPTAIADVVLPYDDPKSDNEEVIARREVFDRIVQEMKAGESGLAPFSRTLEDGIVESLKLSYAPIYARVLSPVRPDDYTRGATVSRTHLFSIGVARSAATLGSPVRSIKQSVDDTLDKATIWYLSTVGAATFVFILITAKISVAITKPMMILLRVVQRVNSGRSEDDMPPLEGGSREVTQVYSSFAKLYKIVRMANSSFFSGDFKWAHHIASDALKLFTRIKDKKAEAIACNNIGNTLFALAMEKHEKRSCVKVDGVCYVNEAIKHYDEAILLGTRDFEASDSDTEKAAFAQQLADRHFNRAMFLLNCEDEPCTRATAKETAFSDLSKCREYDSGVQEFMLHTKTMFKYSDVVYDRLLRRIHGLSQLFTIDSAVWQLWDVNELVEQADLMLQAAWDQDEAPLFEDITRVGRLQQLEGAVIGLEINSGKLEEAAQLAMRMLVEDEYIIFPSFVVAAECFLKIMKEPSLTWPKEAKLRTSLEFRRMRRSGRRTDLDIERCFIFCIDFGEVPESGQQWHLGDDLVAFYEEQCTSHDSVGVVSVSEEEDDDYVAFVGPKSQEDFEQKEALRSAGQVTGDSSSRPALLTAVNLVVSPSRSRTSDIFLIYVTDGSRWDKESFSELQKKIKGASNQRTASIHVIAIGIGVKDEAFEESCTNLCMATRSRNSKYLTSTSDSLSEALDAAGSLISSSSSSESSKIRHGITMERF